MSQASRDCQAAMEATQAGAFDERNADLCVAGVAQIVIATDRRPATMTGVKAAEAQQQRRGERPGMKGRLPDAIWNMKEFPAVLGMQ